MKHLSSNFYSMALTTLAAATIIHSILGWFIAHLASKFDDQINCGQFQCGKDRCFEICRPQPICETIAQFSCPARYVEIYELSFSLQMPNSFHIAFTIVPILLEGKWGGEGFQKNVMTAILSFSYFTLLLFSFICIFHWTILKYSFANRLNELTLLLDRNTSQNKLEP